MIHDKLNELNIENSLHVGEGQLYEYWGTLNGNWFGGPNDNYEQIKNNAYNFLYDQLNINQNGDINNDGILNVLDIVLLVNIILSNEYDIIADINEDGFIDILDVVMMVNILISEN